MAQEMRVLQHQQISSEATQIAETHQLGTPTAEYKTALKLWDKVGIVAGLLVGLILIVAAISQMATDSQQSIVYSILAVLCLGWAIYAIITAFMQRNWRAYVYTAGFAHVRGGKTQVFRWEQMAQVLLLIARHSSYGVNTGTTHKYTLIAKDGTKIVFNDKWHDVENLGNTLCHEAQQAIFPGAKAAFDAGETVNFGPLSASAQGLSKGSNTLRWDEVAQFGLSNGHVIVTKVGKKLSWADLLLAQVPNFEVLATLVQQARKA